MFALSAGMAGVGGALLAGVYSTATAGYFTFFEGLPVLLLGVVGGIGAVSGAFIAVVLIGLFEALGRDNPSLVNFLAVLPGLAAIGLARNPGGLASDFSNLYHSVRQKVSGRTAAGAPPASETPEGTGRELAGAAATAPTAAPAGAPTATLGEGAT